MKNLQLLVDMDENCGSIETQVNSSKDTKMCSENLKKTETLKILCKDAGVVVVDLGILKFSSSKTQGSEVKNCKDAIEVNSKKLLGCLGIDTELVKKYIFGKHVAFALSYGASKQKAIRIGLGALKKNIFSGIASNPKKINRIRKNPEILNSYDDVVGNLFMGNVDIAQTLAINLWKKSLAKNIVESVDELEMALVIEGLDIKDHSVILGLIRKAKGFAEKVK